MKIDAATRIRTARTTERLTQAKLAARAATTQSAIAAYESGSRSPSTKTLDRLLRASGSGRVFRRPWRRVTGMRNRLVHHYEATDPAQVWVALERSIPELVGLLGLGRPRPN